MINKTIPDRPETGEIAPPELTALQIGQSWVRDQMQPWLDEIGRDPRSLRGQQGDLHLFDVTLTDTKVRALLGQRLDAGTAPPLEIEPGGPMRRDRMVAEDLAEQLNNLEIDRSRVRLADLRVRHPAVLRWDPLLIARARPAGARLPPAKFVLLTNPRAHGGQPHGRGVGAWCFWPVWLKRFACRGWSVALDRFATPLAIARTRRGSPEEEHRKALDTLAALSAGTSIDLPEGIDIDILEATRRAGGDYNMFARDMDRMIADALVGQHGTTEIGPHVGTGEVHMKVLERLVTADARRCAEALRCSVASWLTHWNFPGAAIPRLRRDTAPPEDLEARARRDLTIAQASGLRPARAYVEQVYGGEWEEAPGAPDAAAEHARSFTVAKVARLDILADIRQAMDRALAEGTTFETFRNELEPILRARGWWGREVRTDPLTGETRTVQLGSPRRLRTIFDTNLRIAVAAGKWAQIARLAHRRPWLRYIATLDDRTRPGHRRWHGTILRHDHAFWQTHFPPCGWHCRCTVPSLSDADLERFGLTPSPQPPGDWDRTRPWINRRTGTVQDVPIGIDPGFAHNPGTVDPVAGARAILRDRLAAVPPDIALTATSDVTAWISRGRTTRRALVAATGLMPDEDGFADRMRGLVARRLTADRGAGTEAARSVPVRNTPLHNAATEAVEAASLRFPADWVAHARAIPLRVVASRQRTGRRRELCATGLQGPGSRSRQAPGRGMGHRLPRSLQRHARICPSPASGDAGGRPALPDPLSSSSPAGRRARRSGQAGAPRPRNARSGARPAVPP